MSKQAALKINCNLPLASEDICFSEDEDNSLSAKLNSLERSRNANFPEKNISNLDSLKNALTFDSLIKKTPFLDDFKFRNASNRNSSEVSSQNSTDQTNTKNANNFSTAIKNFESGDLRNVIPYSADLSLDGSPKFSTTAVRAISETHERSSSVDTKQNLNLNRGILKTGVRSRFYKDLQKKDPQMFKLGNSKKSSSFKIAKGDKSKPSSRGNSPLKYSKTSIKR